jgi:hypothetical protein
VAASYDAVIEGAVPFVGVFAVRLPNPSYVYASPHAALFVSAFARRFSGSYA